MIPQDGYIIAVRNFGPLHNLRTERRFAALRSQLSDDQLRDAVPKVSHWSDIVWTSWLSYCEQVNRKPHELQSIIHNAILTANTKYIMEQVVDPDTKRNGLNIPWPGKEFFVTTDGGKALLGTVHGSGTSRLLFDHRQETDGIPKKGIQKVTVFTGDVVNAYGRDYYLNFHAG